MCQIDHIEIDNEIENITYMCCLFEFLQYSDKKRNKPQRAE